MNEFPNEPFQFRPTPRGDVLWCLACTCEDVILSSRVNDHIGTKPTFSISDAIICLCGETIFSSEAG